MNTILQPDNLKFNETVGDSIVTQNASWSFAGDTPKSFDSHVEKSVPLYHEGHDLVVKLSDFFVSQHSVCYDIGCSTGTLTRMIANRNQSKGVRVIGLDGEKDMISYAQQKNSNSEGCEFYQADALEFDYKKSDFIVLYYTLQFVKPKVRQLLINRLYESLNWGGALVLFEKVRASDARFQDIATSLYTDYKLEQGYSAEQIISKSRSLKGILEPFSSQGNIDLMKRAGFIDIVSIMKYVCFEGFLAIK